VANTPLLTDQKREKLVDYDMPVFWFCQGKGRKGFWGFRTALRGSE